MGKKEEEKVTLEFQIHRWSSAGTDFQKKKKS